MPGEVGVERRGEVERAGDDMMSASSGPCVAARNSRASSAQRASGPWWEIESNRPGQDVHRDPPEPRLEADDAAPRRRDAHRAAHVAALGERHAARRDRGAAAARRAAGRAVEVVRVAGDAPQRAVGLQRVGELRRRRLADDDGAGPAQGGDDVGVAVGHPVLEGVRAERRAVAGDRRGVLDRDGHAVQHAERVAAGDAPARPASAASHRLVDPDRR